MRRSEKDASSHSASARWSSGSDERLAVEVAAATAPRRRPGRRAGCRYRLELALERALDVVERVARWRRSPAARSAACTGSWTRPQSAWLATTALAGEQRAQARGDRALARAAGAGACRRSSNGTVEPLNASSESAAATIAASSSAPASRTASPPAAAIRCVPLISARPSLARASTGARPARASASRARQPLAADRRLALADQHEREVRERREVAAGADRAAARHDRHDVALEQRQQQLDELAAARPSARAAASVAEQEQHAAHDLGRRAARRADGVRAHEVELQLRGVGRRDAHRRQMRRSRS